MSYPQAPPQQQYPPQQYPQQQQAYPPQQYPQQQQAYPQQQYPQQQYPQQQYPQQQQQQYSPQPATNVYVNQSTAQNGDLDSGMFVILTVIGLLTGLTGIQRFYTKDYCVGITQLLLGVYGWLVFCVITFGVGTILPYFIIAYIWALVDLCQADSLCRGKA